MPHWSMLGSLLEDAVYEIIDPTVVHRLRRPLALSRWFTGTCTGEGKQLVGFDDASFNLNDAFFHASILLMSI